MFEFLKRNKKSDDVERDRKYGLGLKVLELVNMSKEGQKAEDNRRAKEMEKFEPEMREIIKKKIQKATKTGQRRVVVFGTSIWENRDNKILFKFAALNKEDPENYDKLNLAHKICKETKGIKTKLKVGRTESHIPNLNVIRFKVIVSW